MHSRSYSILFLGLYRNVINKYLFNEMSMFFSIYKHIVIFVFFELNSDMTNELEILLSDRVCLYYSLIVGCQPSRRALVTLDDKF